MPDRAILHVDMDAFYASVEVLENPELRGKPVVVGGTAEQRGVVAAASYEARRYGIHSAMSSYRARKLCPDAIFIPPRMRHYVTYSKRIFDVFRSYTPLVEPISIDEAFLDVMGSRQLFGTAVEIGRSIKRRIREEIGLTASVGVAPNKFLAKLASDLEKPDGFVVIEAKEAAAKLAALPVGKLWGIGKVTEQALARRGVHLVSDMLAMPPHDLEAIVGSHAHRLRELAQGIDDRPVVVGHESKSISAETTFAEDISDGERLRGCVDDLSERVGKRLRKEGFRAHTIQLKARYADFTTVTRAQTLHDATASTQVIRDTARALLESRLERRGRAMRLLGVGISNLVRAEDDEGTLFTEGRNAEGERLDHMLDDLQRRFGPGSIRRGKPSPEGGEEA